MQQKSEKLDINKIQVPLIGLAEEYGSLSSKPHTHALGQLYYCVRGTIKVQIASGIWLVSPQRAVWIPEGMVHQSSSKHSVGLRILYINQNEYAGLPEEVCVFQICPLLRELISAAITQGYNWPPNGHESRLSQVIVDRIITSPKEPLYLPLPSDPRALSVCQMMQKAPKLHSDINTLCQKAGLSQRTLVRILQNETKMNLQQWRQQLLLITAIEMMSMNKSITTIAMDLGYANPSAFITMFRKVLGVSPSEYSQ